MDKDIKELVKKYEVELSFLNERLETATYIGDNQRLRIDSRIEVYEKVLQDLRGLVNKHPKKSMVQKFADAGERSVLESNTRGELLPKRLSNKAYHMAKSLKYEDFVEWWDSQLIEE